MKSKKIILIYLLLLYTLVANSQDVDFDGHLSVSDSFSIGTDVSLDQLYLFKSGLMEPSLLMHQRSSLLGSDINTYGRTWLNNNSLNIGYGRQGDGSSINLHDNFLRLNGPTFISPPDVCEDNGILSLSVVIERNVINSQCPDFQGTECDPLCSIDQINLFAETPFNGEYNSNLGTFDKPWTKLYTEFATVNSLKGFGTRRVNVSSDGRLIVGSSTTSNGIYTVQATDFMSSFYAPFSDFQANYFVGSNLPSNVNTYLAAVHIPQGATIDSIVFKYRDNNIKEGLTMTFLIGSTSADSGSPTSDEDFRHFSTDEDICGSFCSKTIPVNKVVDNSKHTYYLIVGPGDTTWDTSAFDPGFGTAAFYYRE